MDIQTITFVISIASFLGVVLGQTIPAFLRLRELKEQAKAESQAKWIGFLQLGLANLQAVNNSVNANSYLISSTILSIDDKQMQEIAENKNLTDDHKLQQAIIRLGQLIREELKKT